MTIPDLNLHFLKSYSQSPLMLYKTEIVPVPIIDQNSHTNSYTEIQISKPYIDLHDEIYISWTAAIKKL